MTKNEFLALADEYTKGTCTPEEAKLIERFCEKVQIKDIAQEWSLSQEQQKKIALLKRINKRINGLETSAVAPTVQTIKKEQKIKVWTIAACLALLLAVGFGTLHIMKPEKIEAFEMVATNKGEQTNITLSDGSVVLLNAESSLRFPKEFGKRKRAVFLEGEAFFDVAKDRERPFRITSGDLVTEVLGTSFNIESYSQDETIKVTVASGKVKVRKSERASDGINDRELFLLPEQQAVFNKKTSVLSNKKVAINNYIGWKDSLILLNGNTLEETVNKLERLFDVEFLYDGQQYLDCTINGEFRRDELPNILENISFLTGLEFKMLSTKKIQIMGQSCN